MKLLCLLAASIWACDASLSHSLNGAQSSSRRTPPPSVVLITLDTLRADHLGCYGYRPIETPSIDKLASEGIRFEHVYSQVPLTLPSHTVIMTGTYPMFNGVRDLTSTGLDGKLPTLAEILHQNGYRTAAFVSSFVLNSMWGLNRGFDVYDDATDPRREASDSSLLLERRGDRTMNRALAWLDSHFSQPFFLWVHLYDPHSPYRPPEPYFTRYTGHLYDGEIAFDDAQLGRLFLRLRQLNLYEGTLIVLASDHGESLGEHGEAEHGFFIYNATLRVPLVLKLPGSSLRPRLVLDPAGLVDLAPTITALCGIPKPFSQSFQGHPLAAVQEHVSRQSGAPVYAESNYPRSTFGWHELRAIVSSQYKYIDAPRPELYDLVHDADEKLNLAASRAAIALALRKQLQAVEARYASASPPQALGQLDPQTLQKLRSLGYVAYQAPEADGNSSATRADPKDKIQVFDQVRRVSELRTQLRFAEADEILAPLERSEPTLYSIPFERGETLLDWGKPREAAGEFRKALALNPSFDRAWAALGSAASVLGDNKEAIRTFGYALSLNPRNYLARRSLAGAYWRENQPGKAELELARIVSEHPDFAEGRAEHGIALAKVGRCREAVAELRTAFDRGYQGAMAYYYLGISYSEIGDATLAIEAYQKAVAADPGLAVAYARLALQYNKAGELSKARQCYQKACKLSEEFCGEFPAQF